MDFNAVFFNVGKGVWSTVRIILRYSLGEVQLFYHFSCQIEYSLVDNTSNTILNINSSIIHLDISSSTTLFESGRFKL